jgi:hypothetical protein
MRQFDLVINNKNDSKTIIGFMKGDTANNCRARGCSENQD